MISQELSFKENDVLNRESIVTDINRYIELSERFNTKSAISIGVNSKWGSGKTFFMNMWKTALIEKDEKVIFYDVWENDDCGSALLPLLYNIVSITTDGDEAAYLQYVKSFLKTVFFETTKVGVKKLFGENSSVKDILENGISSIKDEDLKTVFKRYDDYYGDRKTLEETLTQIVGIESGKLWVFIDDLDRCEPGFAISTLECIKHFFNIPNIVFIFGIDMEQLQRIATNVYGSKIDPNSYLKRFFDCIYDLPDPNTEVYIKYKVEQMCINDSVKSFINIKDISKFSRHFKCSLRDINHVLIHLEVFLKDNEELIRKCSDARKALKVYYYFMIVKEKYAVDYSRIIHGDYAVDSATTSHRTLIDRLFITEDNTINKLIVAISEGQSMKVCTDIFNEYSLFTSQFSRFKDHIQFFIK